MAKLKLSQVPVGSHYIDSSSKMYKKYNDDDVLLDWIVVGQNEDGEGVTTLILDSSQIQMLLMALPFDAKEPTNPDAEMRDKGNPSYALSNILQWLNSDGGEGEWFTATHEYDQSPVSPYVSTRYYGDNAGFLHYCSDDFKNALISVTKYGVSKKLHIPSYKEITPAGYSVSTSTPNHTTFDEGGIQYRNYIFTDWLTSRPSPNLIVRGDANKNGSIGGVPAINIYNRHDLNKIAPRDPFDCISGVYLAPMVFMSGNSPVEYNTINQKYYASWDNAPVIVVNSNLGQHKGEFDFSFKITDADGDAVTAKAYVDDDSTHPIFDNSVTLNTNINATVPANTMSGLEYGNHRITINANDGSKTSTATSLFEKYDIAPTIEVTSDLGQKKYAFDFTLKIKDADDTSSDLTVELDGNEIYSDSEAPLDTNITISVSSSVFSELSYDTHTIEITAYDGVKTTIKEVTFQKIALTSPVITADEIGNKTQAFSLTYQVDSESADSINVVVKLDGTQIDTKSNVPFETDIELIISDSRFYSLEYGSHNIAIIATDNDEYSSTRTLPFKKCSIPTLNVNMPQYEVESPFAVEVTADSADGDNITITAKIDGQEIEI